jgi:hypothetical protein
MHRRPLGNGRRLAFLAAVVVLLGSVLPWYTVGGDGGLTPIVYRAFDGSGIVTFLAALATIALVALPYAAGDRPVAVDRGVVFGLLAAAAIAGVVLWVPGVLEVPEGLLPDRAYGLWIAAVGVIMLGRAAYEIVLEPPRR